MVASQGASAAITTRDPERRRAERAMGTVVSLFAPDGGAMSDAANAAFAWIHEAERRFSPFDPGSEVSRLMRGEIAPGAVSADLAEVLDIAEAIELLSGGAFDIRRHRADGRPDPTGIVKGWAVDRAASMLADSGILRFSIGAGGDVVVRGGEAPGVPWRIGVANPFTVGTVALVLEAHDLAIATSGTAERGLHVVDARTGRPADELLAVTVVGQDLARADGYATAAFAMGRAGLRWVDSLPGSAAAGITHDGRLLSTPGLDRYRAQPADGTARAVHGP
jgi:thiamine biosynthesis lipoprotein